MKCPNCGAENPDGKTYCQKCASPLESIRKAPMKRNAVITASVLLIVLSVLLTSVLVLASVPEFKHSTKIPAGESLNYQVVAVKGDNITVSWESSQSLVFYLVDPNGEGTFSTGSDSFSRTFSAYLSGEWTLKWINTRESSVKISFDASSSTLESIRSPLLTEIMWLVAIIVILIIVLMAIIVFVVRRSGLFRQGQ